MHPFPNGTSSKEGNKILSQNRIHEGHEGSKNLAKKLSEVTPQMFEKVAFNSLSIRSEILKRDITKRQANILNFIYILSYVKNYAVIPRLADFEMCGVSKTLIKKELLKLEGMNVLTWAREENIFKINEPSTWTVPYHDGYSTERARKVFKLNMDLIPDKK